MNLHFTLLPDGFAATYPTLPIDAWTRLAKEATPAQVDAVLARGRAETPEDFAVLLSPAASDPARLERMAALARTHTLRHFGKTIRLFAPIYLSNECINNCKYCGFSRDNQIPRITIPLQQAEDEMRMLADQGFRSILIVAGEHPKYVSNGYVVEVVRRALRLMPDVAIELGPMETEHYRPIVEAGCEGLIVYQETYDKAVYESLHISGPKRHCHWRMDTPERGYAAGFRRLGIGALLGLNDWRREVVSLAAHGRHLLRRCWKSTLTVSLPRMRPAAGEFQVDPAHCPSDREFVQALFALRLYLPTAGITQSTREPARMRDGLMGLCITHVSAGACTEPGGYSNYDPATWRPRDPQPGEQFHIADERSPREVADAIRGRGLEPVWKDFDSALASPHNPASP